MLSMATIIIFLVFALKPTALTIISLYNEIQEKQKTVALLDQKISALATARRLMDQNQSSIANIDASVTDSPRPDLLVQQIQALAVKNSVTVLGISVGQVSLMGAVQTAQTSAVVPLPGNAGQMEVSVSVRGDYPNLITLLNDIKNLRMVTKVDSTGINSSESDQGRIIVAVVSGRAPYIGQ
jgi:hypothetical protein